MQLTDADCMAFEDSRKILDQIAGWRVLGTAPDCLNMVRREAIAAAAARTLNCGSYYADALSVI